MYMFSALHVNWAGTLLACVALVLAPIPAFFYKYGDRIRARSKFAPTLPKAPMVVDDSGESASGNGNENEKNE